MATGLPDWFKGTVLYGIGPADEFIPIRTDEEGNLHVGYGSHAITHQDGGSDEISVAGLVGLLADEQLSSWGLVSGKPVTFAPSAHAADHENGGIDEINVVGLSGLLADEQPSSWALVSGKPATFAPSAHAADHENGGIDEINVVDLSGLLADTQTPKSHSNTAHSPRMVEVDGTEPLTDDWDIGVGRTIEAEQIKARSNAGLKLFEDGGVGIFVKDGGDIGIRTLTPLAPLHLIKDRIGTGVTAAHISYPSSTVIYEDTNGGFEFFASQAGTWGAFISLKEVNSEDMSLSDTWGIIRQTLDGTGNGSLHFTYGAGINPWANDSILAMLPSGNIGINKAVPTEKLDVAGNIGVSGTVDGVDVAAHHVRHESGGDDPIPINALGITGTLDIVGQKTYLRGNASASLLHLSRITTTTWYGWDLSSIVGSRTAVVFIRVDNNTGSNHSYAIAPLSSDVWFPADFGWERGTASGQIDSADEGILIAYTNASGVVYLRAESNHDHATDYYLVGFI